MFTLEIIPVCELDIYVETYSPTGQAWIFSFQNALGL